MDAVKFLKQLEPYLPTLLEKVGGDAYSKDLLEQAQELLKAESPDEALQAVAQQLLPFLTKFLPPPVAAGAAVAVELFPAILAHFTEKGVTVVYEKSELEHPPELI